MKRTWIFVAVAVLALLSLMGQARADILLQIPEDISPSAYTSPDGPSPFLPGVIQDGVTAAIPFYRPPECVPLDFNLLDWIDASMEALDCPFLLSGFGIWPGTEPTGFPITTQLRGDGAVPVWFVSWSELQAAMADGELTIVELASLPSLEIGTATSYEEQLHYQPPHPASFSCIQAHGTMADGRSFSVRAIENALEWNHVHINFR